MSMWEHVDGRVAKLDKHVVLEADCLYCATPLSRNRDDEYDAAEYDMLNYGRSDGYRTRSEAIIGFCPACGWWKVDQLTVMPAQASFPERTSRTMRCGLLRDLDLSDVSIPLVEIRRYLTARYDQRFKVDPKVFEEVVGSVFRDHGYSVRVTAFSGDDGIDAILDASSGGTIGVQVKRYKEKISVDQIRELTGALVIGGHTKGVFVTTSDFQSGATRTAEMSAAKGYPIELIDAKKFYDALKIAQLASPINPASYKPWGPITRFV